MTEDSGAFKTNPGDCAGFGHFVKARESSGKPVLLPRKDQPKAFFASVADASRSLAPEISLAVTAFRNAEVRSARSPARLEDRTGEVNSGPRATTFDI
jgi:hypothetical protein